MEKRFFYPVLCPSITNQRLEMNRPSNWLTLEKMNAVLKHLRKWLIKISPTNSEEQYEKSTNKKTWKSKYDNPNIFPRKTYFMVTCFHRAGEKQPRYLPQVSQMQIFFNSFIFHHLFVGRLEKWWVLLVMRLHFLNFFPWS